MKTKTITVSVADYKKLEKCAEFWNTSIGYLIKKAIEAESDLVQEVKE